MSDMDTDYGLLLHRFLAGALSAKDFQRAYLERFKNESRELDDSLFEILDRLFGDVDAFCADPALLAELTGAKPGFYLDKKALRAKVVQRLNDSLAYKSRSGCSLQAREKRGQKTGERA